MPLCNVKIRKLNSYILVFSYPCKQNYFVSNATVYHLGSLSSAEKKFSPILRSDAKIYRRLTLPWYKFLFSFDEFKNHYKLRLLGVTLNIRKKFFRQKI